MKKYTYSGSCSFRYTIFKNTSLATKPKRISINGKRYNKFKFSGNDIIG